MRKLLQKKQLLAFIITSVMTMAGQMSYGQSSQQQTGYDNLSFRDIYDVFRFIMPSKTFDAGGGDLEIRCVDNGQGDSMMKMYYRGKYLSNVGWTNPNDVAKGKYAKLAIRNDIYQVTVILHLPDERHRMPYLYFEPLPTSTDRQLSAALRRGAGINLPADDGWIRLEPMIEGNRATLSFEPSSSRPAPIIYNMSSRTRTETHGMNGGTTSVENKIYDSSKQEASYLNCPDNNHPHAIDLGLPSGTKWACCNVGAGKPEDYGGYYSWGETETKSTYDWITYTHCDGTANTCHDLGRNITGTQYDVAHVKWDGSWVMPSWTQLHELYENCSSEWTTFNGVKGWKFTSKKNGGTVFLPAAGYRWNDDLGSAGSNGYYWSSTQDPSSTSRARGLYYGSSSARWGYGLTRDYGRTVRPVSK